MRIALIWSYYPRYLSQLYARNRNLSSQSYSAQIDYIFDDYCGWVPSVLRRLAERGNDVNLFIVNAKPAQEAWARQNGFPFDERTWRFSVPIEQVRRLRPDILWIGSMFQYFGDFLKAVRQYCHRVFAWTACPIPGKLDLSNIDRMLTSHANYLDIFREAGKDGDIVLPCFEPRILDLIGGSERTTPVSFIGSLTFAQKERIRILQQLRPHIQIRVWTSRPSLMSRNIVNPYFWRSYLAARSIAAESEGEVYGLDMYRALAQSKITINSHQEGAAGLAGNMRMFEATGTATLLFTECAPNLDQLFHPETELVSYRETGELLEKISYYLGAPQAADEIAKAGQRRTLACHDSVTRSRQIEEIFVRNS